MITNKDVAIELILKLNKNISKNSWKNVDEVDIRGKIYSTTQSSSSPIDGYILLGDNQTFTVIGKYCDRFYTDEDEFVTTEGYYLTFGKFKDTPVFKFDVKAAATVRENELSIYRKNLKELYDSILMQQMGVDTIDNFLENF